MHPIVAALLPGRLSSDSVAMFAIRLQTFREECRILPFLYADISGVTDFQLLADGDNILYLDNSRI